MRSSLISAALTSLSGALLAQASVTVYLCGDSTMAVNGAGNGITDVSWGNYLAQYLTRPVVNKAIGGRSARSFTREGRFAAVAAAVAQGDFVVIEFGHNDGGSLSTDNGRTDCPGAGSETCATVYNGVAETVLTFPAYEINAAKLMIAKGAHVIVSSATPNNPWEGGVYSEPTAVSRFTTYAQLAANSTGSLFLNHGLFTFRSFKALGNATVNSYYPSDHTHTSPAGAQVVARAFVRALVCSGTTLAGYVNSAGLAITGTCYTS